MNLPNIEARPDLYDEAERWSVDELRARQLERLQWSVRHAFDHVPHYRKAFEDRGVHPDDIRSLDDTRLLPFTSKADLRANYPFGMFAVPREQVVAGARLQRHDRQAHRRRLHRRGPDAPGPR